MKNRKYLSLKKVKVPEDAMTIMKDMISELGSIMPESPFGRKPEGILKYQAKIYWGSPEIYPYFLMEKDKILGFAVIQIIEKNKYELVDFYVKPEFRKNNMSLDLVNFVYENFEGEWRLYTGKTPSDEVPGNIRAIKFWKKFASQFRDVEFIVGKRTYSWVLNNKLNNSNS